MIKRRPSLPLWIFIPAWTLMLLGLWLLVSLAHTFIGPTQRSQHIVVRMEPNSAEYDSIVISEIMSPHKHGGRVMGKLSVEGHKRSRRDYDEIDLSKMTYATHSTGVLMSKTQTRLWSLDRDAVLRAMREVGADTDLLAVVDEAEEVITMLRSIPNSGVQNLTPTHFTVFSAVDRGHDVPAKWFIFLLVALTPLVWVAGLIFFLRIRHIRPVGLPTCEIEA